MLPPHGVWVTEASPYTVPGGVGGGGGLKSAATSRSLGNRGYEDVRWRSVTLQVAPLIYRPTGRPRFVDKNITLKC